LLGKALLARGGEDDAAVEFSAVGLTKCAAGLSALFGYVLLLDTLGFLLSTFLFLVAVTPLFGRVPWWMWLGVPAVVAAAAHVAFVVVLRLRLPAGLLPL
jgi:hypothetical protein